MACARSGCARCGCAEPADPDDRGLAVVPAEPERTYVNVGFWGAVPSATRARQRVNRAIEEKVTELGGHKSLYSDAFYDRRPSTGSTAAPTWLR